MRRIMRRTVCTAESTTESRSAISHTFHNDMEKRNPYRSINQIISLKDSKGSMLASAHASMIYTVWKIKSKMEQILPIVFPT
jgi:hypothetical protein